MTLAPDSVTLRKLEDQIFTLRQRVAELEGELHRRTLDERLELVLESLPIPVIITRFSDTLILAANRHVNRLFGVPLNDPLTRRWARDFFYSQRDFRRLVVDVHRLGSVHDIEVQAKRIDGTPVWVAVSMERIQYHGVAALASGFYDLTERKQAETELRRFAQELQVRNDELDAFAHTVAHDLKSPLSIIAGYSELLLDMDSAESEALRRDGLNLILSTVDKINNIIDELMLLAEVRKGAVEAAPLAMGVIANEACARLDYLARQHQAEITIAPVWPTALGYAPWIEEVWINYVSNAIKYGGRPPCLELGGELTDGDQARFWVRDNGPGLSADDQARLFAPFAQLAHTRATGHGLGLSIVRRIVEKLGGTVGVESTIGRGSTFYFTLPTQLPD